jgi:hypothetical protein
MKYPPVVIWGRQPCSNLGPPGAIQQHVCVAVQSNYVNAQSVICVQILSKYRFFMLHISLPEAHDSESLRADISDLVLDEFTRAELLDGTNKYYCSSCKALHVGHRYNLI